MNPSHDATHQLTAARAGDIGAHDRLFRRVYDALRDGARQRLQRAGGTEGAGTTTLINDCWLRMIERGRVGTADRTYFLALAARAMRLVLVDVARARSTGSGSDVPRPSGAAAQIAADERATDLIDLSQSLDELAGFDAHLGETASLRFFGGLGFHDIAEITGRPVPRVKLDWVRARAWIYRSMQRAVDARA